MIIQLEKNHSPTRLAPVRYKLSGNPYKRPYKWVTWGYKPLELELWASYLQPVDGAHFADPQEVLQQLLKRANVANAKRSMTSGGIAAIREA